MDESSGPWSYRRLQAWQRAMDLAEMVYTASQNWPKEETYGLTSQIRRAAVSIPSNVAEGHGRGWNREFLHHLRIARSSLLEVETQMLLAQRLRYVTDAAASGILVQADEVSRLITGLVNRLQSDRGIANRVVREEPGEDSYEAGE